MKTFENQNYILFYFYSLGGMVLTGASTSDCAHRGLAVNAPDWGLAHRFLVGTAVQGTEIFQVQFDVASSTATCYYGLWLSLVLTGNPYLRTAIGEGLSLPKLRAAWSGIGGCYGKASSQSPPSRTPKCVMINGVGCVMWGTCTTSAEGLT